MSEAHGYGELNAHTLGNIGKTYTSQGAYAKGLEYCQKSLTASESLGDKAGIAGALANIANVHFAQSNYTQALEYYQRCLKMGESLGIKSMTAKALTQVGRSYRALNQLTPARQAFEEAVGAIETLRAQVAGGAQALAAKAAAGEEVAAAAGAVWVHFPEGAGRSKLPAHFDRCLGSPTTARNWKSVLALRELLAGPAR